MDAQSSLLELLEGVRDPRGTKGKRHLFAVAAVAMLAGMISYEGIVQYGKERSQEFHYLSGFTRGRGLRKATYSRVFRRIDVAEFEVSVSGSQSARLFRVSLPSESAQSRLFRC